MLLHGLIPFHPIAHTVVTEGTLATVKVVQGVEAGLGKVRRPDEAQIKMRNYEISKISNLMKLTVQWAKEASLSASDLKSRSVRNWSKMLRKWSKMVRQWSKMVKKSSENIRKWSEKCQKWSKMARKLCHGPILFKMI